MTADAAACQCDLRAIVGIGGRQRRCHVVGQAGGDLFRGQLGELRRLGRCSGDNVVAGFQGSQLVAEAR
jgi:hypothetical protein